MTEIFVFGSLLFWLLLALEVVVLFIFIEFEHGVAATISLLIFGALLQFMGNVDIIETVASHPWHALGLVGLYFVLGTAWSIIKWYVFCYDRLQEYKDSRNSFRHERHLPVDAVLTAEQEKEFQSWLSKSNAYRTVKIGKPHVSEHKARIMRWMSFWCISMVWSLVNGMVKRVFYGIYKSIAGFLQSISDRMFEGV